MDSAVIYKYQISVMDGMTTLNLSAGSVFIDAAQDSRQSPGTGQVVMWFLHTMPDGPTEPRTFALYGTGNQIPSTTDPDSLIPLRTIKDGPWFWHLFEVVEDV